MKFPKLALVAALVAALALPTPHQEARASGVLVATVAGMVATMLIVGVTLVAGTAVGGGPLRKAALAEVAPDAAQFIASKGENRSALFVSLLEETKKELQEKHADREYSDLEIASMILALNQAE